MTKFFRLTLTLALVSFTAAGLVSCGGGSGMSSDAVAQVGSAAITKASLSHWMSTIIGGDFYEITHQVAPTGLVSDPPDYATCQAGLAKLASSLAQKPTVAQLKGKCEQLHQALKQQALSYLITAQVAIGQDAEQGLAVSAREAERYFKHLQATQFPKESELQTYLADRHWSLSDELFLVKRDLLSSKLRSKLEQKFGGAGSQEALINYVHDANKRWTEKTTCSPGYVTEGCSEYTSAQAAVAKANPSPAVLIEELTS